MRIKSYKTFVLHEAQRLSGKETRSIKQLLQVNNKRANAAVIALMLEEDKYQTNSSNKIVKEISMEAIKVKHDTFSKYKDDVLRYKDFYESYLEKEKTKERYMNMFGNKKKLYSVCKKLGINYGNAFNFFVNKKSSFLTTEKAKKILQEIK